MTATVTVALDGPVTGSSGFGALGSVGLGDAGAVVLGDGDTVADGEGDGDGQTSATVWVPVIVSVKSSDQVRVRAMVRVPAVSTFSVKVWLDSCAMVVPTGTTPRSDAVTSASRSVSVFDTVQVTSHVPTARSRSAGAQFELDKQDGALLGVLGHVQRRGHTSARHADSRVSVIRNRLLTHFGHCSTPDAEGSRRLRDSPPCDPQ